MGFKFNPITGKLDLAGTGEFVALTGTIAAGASIVVYSALASTFRAAKFFCDVRNNEVSRYLEIQVLKTQTGVIDSVTSRLGTGVLQFVASESGSDIILTITNGNANAVDYSIKLLEIT